MMAPPAIPADVAWVYQAWWRLAAERMTGGTPSGTPFLAVNEYAMRYGIEGDEFEEFDALIQAMDSPYLKHFNSRAR